jgi:hypothetical protein
MLPAKFGSIWPSCFRGKDFLTIANQKKRVILGKVYQKTSKALGVSYTSVHRIMNGKRPCKSNRLEES